MRAVPADATLVGDPGNLGVEGSEEGKVPTRKLGRVGSASRRVDLRVWEARVRVVFSLPAPCTTCLPTR